MLPEIKLDALLARHAAIEAELAGQMPPETYIKLSREFAELGPVVDTVKAYRAVASELGDLDLLMRDAATDAEMRAMAEAEKPALEARRTELEAEIRRALLPKDAMDERNVILEIRAGTGGDEASLFAGDLFRMYERYAAKQGWKVEVISASDGTMGGYKEIIAEVRGRGAFAKLKFESGVHRVQRVPATETSGRIHTSTATVAVLPEAQEVDVALNETDLKIDTMRAGGAGGQHVNKTESAIRITHMPSGIVVAVQEDRSQHRNKAKALTLLRAKLYEAERQRQDSQRAAQRRGQVGSGDRSERIRTYNFPQGRITDHRINLTLYKLPQVIEGEALGEVIDTLVTEHQAALLAAEDVGMTAIAGLAAGVSVDAARRLLARALRAGGIEAPALDARLLLGHGLKLDHAGLIAAAGRALTADESAATAALAARRLKHEPVARIVGTKEFWGLTLRLDPATLVPRPETETVIEAALAAIDAGHARAKVARVADLGTGSGALLLALLSELPQARGVGTDITFAALAAARANARTLGLGDRALFLQTDFGAALADGFDLVVANPPYVLSGDIAGLAPDVYEHDPHAALDGGPDGLAAYRRIAAQARRLISRDGLLVLELGAGQAAAVSGLLAAAGLTTLAVRPDLGGVPRALVAGFEPWTTLRSNADQ